MKAFYLPSQQKGPHRGPRFHSWMEVTASNAFAHSFNRFPPVALTAYGAAEDGRLLNDLIEGDRLGALAFPKAGLTSTG